MKKHIKKISTIQKAAAGIGGAVVVLTSATDFFAGNYLVQLRYRPWRRRWKPYGF